jgi:hypothetical protein
MERYQLGQLVLATARRCLPFQPRPNGGVETRSLAAWQRRIRDFADEDVAEGRGVAARPPDEVTLDEVVDRGLDRGPIEVLVENRQRPGIERPAEDGAQLDHAPSGRVEPVEASEHGRVNAIRDGGHRSGDGLRIACRARCRRQRPNDLAGEEWVAVCPYDDRID